MVARAPVAKYHLIEITLAARIREGAYGQGGIPGERELAKEFGVARVTIRNALHRLEDQGLVERHQGRRTAAISGRGELRRRVLRDDLDRFLDRGRQDTRKVLRFEFVPAPPQVADSLGLPSDASVLRIVRVRSAAGTPLMLSEAFIPEPFVSGMTRAALNRRPLIEILEQSGVSIANAEQRVTAAGASPHVAGALGLALHSPVLKVWRLMRDVHGTAVELLHAWYRADRFEVHMELSRAEDATKVWVEYR